jgi:uncharacterized protein YjbI with pentapeptide repeats
LACDSFNLGEQQRGMTDSKYDPYDVDALEKSLNDSATRVSTIWISFLLFSLYLLTAVATVTHRQLFLDAPVTLPALNIQLPLWGFFFLAPILFLIFHVYVLLQLQLLERTARAYNDALDRAVEGAGPNAAMRQRLANTLFAQIFAGAPSEREGWFGACLKAIAWITMALAPILILLAFQFAFLPYHSHLATWLHRLLIAIEIAVFMLVWPRVLGLRQSTAPPSRFPRLLERLRINSKARRWPFRPGLVTMILLYVIICLQIGSFPGEPHVNLLSGRPLNTIACERNLFARFGLIVRYERLVLPGIGIVDDEKLEKIQKSGEKRSLEPYDSERILSFRGRNLQCADFANADLRYVDFGSAALSGIDFSSADLRGASFRGAVLDDADFQIAKLDQSTFSNASLRGASFHSASARGSAFAQAQLQGAIFDYAQLSGTLFVEAQMMGASMVHSWSIASDLKEAQLQGANLERADLRASFFGNTNLQGANLKSANLRASFFYKTQLNGADLQDSQIEDAEFIETGLWRTNASQCSAAYIKEPNFAPGGTILKGVDDSRKYERIELDKLVESALHGVPVVKQAALEQQIRGRLLEASDGNRNESFENNWRNCMQHPRPLAKHQADQTSLIISLACEQPADEPFDAEAIVTIWTGYWMDSYESQRAQTIAQGLVGPKKDFCQGASMLPLLSRKALLEMARDR